MTNEEIKKIREEQEKERQSTEAFWDNQAKGLVGKKIVDARYLTRTEAEGMGFHSRPIVLIMDDGSTYFPSKDDEGNDAGSLFGTDKNGENDDFPVLR